MLKAEPDHLDQMVALAWRYIRTIPQSIIAERLHHMLHAPNYYCFGLFIDNSLETLATGHIQTKLMSGKELTIDCVIVSKKCRSTGQGKSFLTSIEQWAREHRCHAISVDTDLSSSQAQAFYHRARFNISAFPFKKAVPTQEMESVESSQQFIIEI